MSFLVRRRQRESMRAHASVTTHAIALVLEAVDTSSFQRANSIPVEARVLDSEFSSSVSPHVSSERLNERSPLLVEARAYTREQDPETTTSADDETVPPVSESWRVRAANKAYGAIAPEKAADVTPRCSRRC